MCIILAAFIFILVFYFSADIVHLQLSEMVGTQSITIAVGWDIILTLWPIMLASALTGIVVFMLLMKLVPNPKH